MKQELRDMAIGVSLAGVILLSLLTGCSWFHHNGGGPDHPTPVPPDPTPYPNTVTVTDGEVRVGDRPFLGVSQFDLLVNDRAFPDQAAVRAWMQKLAGTTTVGEPPVFNAVEFAALCHFTPGDLAPWKQDAAGKWILAGMDPAFWQRAGMICAETQRAGIAPVIDVVENWAIRNGASSHPLNPANHIDVHPIKIMDPIDWDFFAPGPRQRRPFKCHVGAGGACDGMEIGSRTHPAWWQLVRQCAALVRQYGGIVQGGNEQYTDPEHMEWDRPALKWWAETFRRHAREVAPGAILAHSVAPEHWGMIAPLVDMANMHGNAWGCDRAKIAAAVADLRAIAPACAPVVNTDGCMGSPRFDSVWLEQFGRAAWAADAGAIFIIKASPGIPGGIIQAGRAMRETP